MSGIDYEELIRSPLDDLDSRGPSRWGPVLGGVVVGAIVGYLIMVLLGGGDEAPEAEAVSDATTTTMIEVTAPQYPLGFVELVPGLAARPEEIVIEDGTITVGFTSAVERGQDPAETPWPRGGSWLLETTSGETVFSSRVVFGGDAPGLFSVQFVAPDLDSGDFAQIRLVERWDAVGHDGSASIPFSGEPFELAEPLSIPVTQSVTLLVPRLELGRFQGVADWQISGAELGAVVGMNPVLVDEAGDEVGSYAIPIQITPPATEGTLYFNWQRSFPDNQEGAVSVSLDYTVDVIESSVTDVGFSLVDVPVNR